MFMKSCAYRILSSCIFILLCFFHFLKKKFKFWVWNEFPGKGVQYRFAWGPYPKSKRGHKFLIKRPWAAGRPERYENYLDLPPHPLSHQTHRSTAKMGGDWGGAHLGSFWKEANTKLPFSKHLKRPSRQMYKLSRLFRQMKRHRKSYHSFPFSNFYIYLKC